jgi:hypothetical protein
LSLAMGRPTVVHAAAAEGGASQRLLAEARRLRRYRSGDAAAAPQGRPKVATQGAGLARDPGRDTSLRWADANPKPGQGSCATAPGEARPTDVPAEVSNARQAQGAREHAGRQYGGRTIRGTDNTGAGIIRTDSTRMGSTGTDSTGTDSTGTDSTGTDSTGTDSSDRHKSDRHKRDGHKDKR